LKRQAEEGPKVLEKEFNDSKEDREAKAKAMRERYAMRKEAGKKK